ncbi:MAG: amino acid ABC transporter permease, partial [Rhizobiales bacterium]|nr:amino acid ABC transporter permease [Hyphomicrobiales bacterium]
PQWMYGFYPIDERWRPNLVFLIGGVALIPMLIPSAGGKLWNALFLLIAFPLITIILLGGGNVNFLAQTYIGVISLLLLAAVAVPIAAYGLEDGLARNRLGIILAGAALLVWLVGFFIDTPDVSIGFTSVEALPFLSTVLAFLSGVVSIKVALTDGSGVGRSAFRGWALVAGGLLVAMLLLDIDFGLEPVETSQWGGLLLTLVVAVTGIVASLPIGILLALGRRSKMPVVRMFSIVFIEIWRGVPLITVLFMSSVMLPLFLPAGVNFDKLLRALVGVALFSSAYMAEVVRAGLQAIPRGQYEGAQALGLSYWQMMAKIILPQALKISIPNIVGNFISLFKDTTLVSIIGIFDLLGIVQAGLRDAKWASAASAPTGYFTVALIFWVFCFGMSRYSMFIERRLATGHKR